MNKMALSSTNHNLYFYLSRGGCRTINGRAAASSIRVFSSYLIGVLLGIALSRTAAKLINSSELFDRATAKLLSRDFAQIQSSAGDLEVDLIYCLML